MFNTKSTKFTIDKRYFPRMVSLQQSSHFFGKLLIVAGLEDLNFTFYLYDVLFFYLTIGVSVLMLHIIPIIRRWPQYGEYA